MLKVTLRGLLAHKLRLSLTAVAIVLGIAFVSSTFVVGDTINNTIYNHNGMIKLAGTFTPFPIQIGNTGTVSCAMIGPVSIPWST